jgi:predicted metal-dependent hydrolase
LEPFEGSKEDRLDLDERARLMEEGRREFNRGEFYEAHEHWEEVWNEIDDPERTWVQAMIQIATGLHKLTRDRPDVCLTLLAKALRKLVDAPATLDGYALGKLRADAARVYQSLERREKVDALTIKLIKA